MEANSSEEKLEVVLKDMTSILRDMSLFFNSEEFSDVILLVGDRKFYAHKFVLAKSSSVFKTMLYGKHWPESVGEEITLTETPECQAVFDLFIKYLYTAEVVIDVQTAVGILSVADKYDVTSLKELCLSYMEKNSHVIQIETAVSWYTSAKNMNFSTLESACLEAITLNTKSLLKSSMWIDLDKDFLEEILFSSELVIDQEYDLFVGLSQWLLDESRVASLKENSERLLPLIRFPHVQITELLEVEKSELATQTESSGIVQELLAPAFRFRAVCPTHVLPDFSSNFYKPRDYLTFNIKYHEKSFTDIKKGDIKIKMPIKAYMRLVTADDVRHGLWEISSKCVDNSVWKVSLRSEDLLGKTVDTQTSLLVMDIGGKVIQCQRTKNLAWKACCKYDTEVKLTHPDKAAYLVVLIKPVLTMPAGDRCQ